MKNILEFITKHPVFTRNELMAFLVKLGTTNPSSQTALLQYHIKQGHVIRIKQGLFASIPLGADPAAHPIDPYLIAAKSASDAVLSYHTALEHHGLAYTVLNKFTFCTKTRTQSFLFQNHLFEAFSFPAAVRNTKNKLFATEDIKRQGITIKTTNLERTFVDLLDQPNRSGGWEEICRSIESIAVLNLEQVIKYTLMLKNATTAAKVGYFLEKMQDKLGITKQQLKKLEKHKPKKPHYLNRNRQKHGAFINRWNLIIPEKIIKQQWEEPLHED